MWLDVISEAMQQEGEKKWKKNVAQPSCAALTRDPDETFNHSSKRQVPVTHWVTCHFLKLVRTLPTSWLTALKNHNHIQFCFQHSTNDHDHWWFSTRVKSHSADVQLILKDFLHFIKSTHWIRGSFTKQFFQAEARFKAAWTLSLSHNVGTCSDH